MRMMVRAEGFSAQAAEAAHPRYHLLLSSRSIRSEAAPSPLSLCSSDRAQLSDLVVNELGVEPRALQLVLSDNDDPLSRGRLNRAFGDLPQRQYPLQNHSW